MRTSADRLIRRQNEKKRKLAEAGINYDLEPVSYVRACYQYVQGEAFDVACRNSPGSFKFHKAYIPTFK
jgi:hypothetical protein